MVVSRFELLLCALAIAAPLAARGQVAELPDQAVCSQALTEMTAQRNNECAETWYHGDDAVEECCVALADYFGPNSTRPSRNCFCVEGYWTRQQELAERNYIDWSGYLDSCKEFGHEVYYFQDGEGPCAPPAPAPAPAPVAEVAPSDAPAPALEAAVDAAVEEAVEDPPMPNPMRSFGRWLGQLEDDGWGLASFIFGVLAAFGSSAMAFTFIYDAAVDLRACFKRKTA